MRDKTNTLKSAIYGLAVGDALGVPYEFKFRGAFECTDMIGYGTHNQPEGTWSDDTSVPLAEAIMEHVPEGSKLSAAIGIENMVNSLSVGSSGYVVDTFVATMWCLLTTDNYRDCVLKAVNLGSDMDTTAAVAGGLAGIMYGLEGIPDEWLSKMKSMDMIDQELFSSLQ